MSEQGGEAQSSDKQFDPIENLVTGEVEGSVEAAAVRPEPAPVDDRPLPKTLDEQLGGTDAARVPRTRDEIRQIITKSRGEAPTEEQLDHIQKADEEGKWSSPS